MVALLDQLITVVDGPDRDQAREMLIQELSKPEYNRRENLLVRLGRWLIEQLNELLTVLPGSGSLSALVIILVVAIVVAAAVFAFRQRLRDRALAAPAAHAVLGADNLGAQDYRDRAQRAAKAGQWDAVLLDSYRALTASAGERTLLDDAPTRTAHEVAATLATTFPDHHDALRACADAFDRVRYGLQSCTQAEAERVRDLDLALGRARPVAAWAAL
ncbi:MAG: DUF4129 domain-containing protein [Ornithinimicrobium sp.]